MSKPVSPAIKVIAFDLDDTLIDTSGALIPQALKNVHDALIKHGFKLDLAKFNERRLSLTHDHSHKEIFALFAKELGLPKNETDALIEECVQYFYEPKFLGKLPLLADAVDTLKTLKKKYPLYLVSSGRLEGQKRKILASDLKEYFKEIFIIPSADFPEKKEAFLKIIELEKIQPLELLSVGNRLSNEIRFAKEIGGRTCYFQYGEHAHEIPQHPFEKPDYIIYSLKEIFTQCPI